MRFSPRPRPDPAGLDQVGPDLADLDPLSARAAGSSPEPALEPTPEPAAHELAAHEPGPDAGGRQVGAHPVRRLSRASLVWRSAALTIGVLLVTRGTLFGNDAGWPFAPMSQFAFRVGENDAIHSTFLQARTVQGNEIVVPINRTHLGIARAEIEGQLPNIVRQPELLSELATAYHRINPGEPALEQLWLRDRVTDLRDGRAIGQSVRTIVGWPATAPPLDNDPLQRPTSAPVATK